MRRISLTTTPIKINFPVVARPHRIKYNKTSFITFLTLNTTTLSILELISPVSAELGAVCQKVNNDRRKTNDLFMRPPWALSIPIPQYTIHLTLLN